MFYLDHVTVTSISLFCRNLSRMPARLCRRFEGMCVAVFRVVVAGRYLVCRFN